jgi:hypothetical protein
MKTTIIISMVFVFMLMGMVLNSAHAFSRKQCSIWLCLPAGFPVGCSDAYSAMKKRLKRGQSARPPLASCFVSDKTALKTK